MKVEDIPQELVDMLDQDAGKQHGRQGPVLASLARILTRYDEMRTNETVPITDVEAWLKVQREMYRTSLSDGSDGRTVTWWAPVTDSPISVTR
jgi:hypothetical protein